VFALPAPCWCRLLPGNRYVRWTPLVLFWYCQLTRRRGRKRMWVADMLECGDVSWSLETDLCLLLINTQQLQHNNEITCHR
jgi:hypothetical protein